jgi:hypothetical protein
VVAMVKKLPKTNVLAVCSGVASLAEAEPLLHMPEECGHHPPFVWLIRLANHKHSYFKEVYGRLRDAETFIAILHKEGYSHDCEIVKTTWWMFAPCSLLAIDVNCFFDVAFEDQFARCTPCAPLPISVFLDPGRSGCRPVDRVS